jgi:ubiquinone biosynthesis protein COQ4
MRGDMVGVLGETTGDAALQAMLNQLLNCPEGRDILVHKPRIHEEHLDFDALRKLPPNTLGYAYVNFMDDHGFRARDRTPVRYVEDPECAYVMQRYREVHDVWHVLLDLPTDVLGELGQKWLEMLQTGLPMTALSALVGPLRLPMNEKARLLTEHVPWALACHASIKNTSSDGLPPSSTSLLTCYYENYFEMDIEQVRHKLGIISFPAFSKSLNLAGPFVSPFSPFFKSGTQQS